MKRNHYKKGSQVIYHWKEYNPDRYDGLTYTDRWERAVIVAPIRDEYGRFTNDYYDETVILKDGEGKVFKTTLEHVEPDEDPADLTVEELVSLYGQIGKGLLYYSDGRNNLGVFEYVAFDMYDAFWEELRYLYSNDEEKMEENDNAENFALFVKSCERGAFRPALSV